MTAVVDMPPINSRLHMMDSNPLGHRSRVSNHGQQRSPFMQSSAPSLPALPSSLSAPPASAPPAPQASSRGEMPSGKDFIMTRDDSDDQDSSGSEPRPVHTMKPKGYAIQGIDYGIDAVDDQPMSASSSPKPQSQHPTMQQGHGQRPMMQQGHGQRPMMQQGQGQRPMMQQGQRPMQQSYHDPPSPSGLPPSPMLNSSVDMDDRSMGQEMPYLPGFNRQDELHSQGGYSIGNGSINGTMNGSSGMGGNLMNEDMMNRLGEMGMDNSQMMRPPQLSYEELRRKRINGLAALKRLEAQGYEPAKKCSHTTDLDEIEDNVEKLTLQRDLDNSIKFQRKMLVGFATLIESICENEDYNIFELELQGWSESVFENISEYDEVFEELYLKYKDVAHVPPELKLIGMVAGSAWMFHMSRNMFGKAASKVPGFPDVMRADPELRRRYQEVAANLARDKGVPIPKKGANGGLALLGQLIGGKMGGGAARPQPRQPPLPVQLQQQQQQQQQNATVQRQQQNVPRQRQLNKAPQRPFPPQRLKRRPMNDPEDVDNLLSSLTGNNANQGNAAEEDEIDLSAIDSYGDQE